jgi:hypothetical protein
MTRKSTGLKSILLSISVLCLSMLGLSNVLFGQELKTDSTIQTPAIVKKDSMVAVPVNAFAGLLLNGNFSRIAGELHSGTSRYKPVTGAGIFITYPFDPEIEVALEAGYLQKGSRLVERYEESLNAVNRKVDIRGNVNMHYLEAMLGVNYKIKPKVWLGLGITSSFLGYSTTSYKGTMTVADSLSGETTVIPLEHSGSNNVTYDIIDFGITGMVHYRLSDNIRFSLRYNTDLIGVSASSSSPLSNKYRNEVVGFTAYLSLVSLYTGVNRYEKYNPAIHKRPSRK